MELDVNPAQRLLAVNVIADLGVNKPEIDPMTGFIRMPLRDGSAGLAEIIRRLDASGIAAKDILQRRPTLDDVFLKLTHKHEPQMDNF